MRLPHKAQGCAGWARNPKGLQITPFCHQMGRRGTIWDLGTAPRRRISLRISPGGVPPPQSQPFFDHFGTQKNPHVNFWEISENGLPRPGRIWAHARHGSRTPWLTHATAHARHGSRTPRVTHATAHARPRGPMGPHMGPHGGPRGPMGPHGPPMGPHGAPWGPMRPHGSLMGAHGAPWAPWGPWRA